MSVFAAALFREMGRSVIFAAAGREEAEEAFEEFQGFVPPEDVRLFPPYETGEIGCASMRLRAVSGLHQGPVLAAAPVRALLQKLLKSEDVGGEAFGVSTGSAISPGSLAGKVSSSGYKRVHAASLPGEFAVRGGIFDVFPVQEELPSRIEFDGNSVASIRRFDPESQLSVEKADSVKLLNACSGGSPSGKSLFSVLPADSVVVIKDPPRFYSKAGEVGLFEEEILGEEKASIYMSGDELSNSLSRFRTVGAFPFGSNGDSGPGSSFLVSSRQSGRGGEKLRDAVLSSAAKGYRVFVFCRGGAGHGIFKDFPEAEDRHGKNVTFVDGFLGESFALPCSKLAFFSSGGLRAARARGPRRLPPAERPDELSDGDYVVHINHGIGIYRGLRTIESAGKEEEFIRIEYLDGDMLYIPPSRIGLISRYAGVEGHEPVLSRLGGGAWRKARERAEKSIRDLAGELLELGAERQAGEGFGFSPDNDWQKGIEGAFPYEETPGQLEALEAIKRDMESQKPMDRLVCGDSGYGKTELAVRAAFKCAMDGKQTAVLVPTTVLSEQHFTTFSERIGGYPLNIAVLNRFRSTEEQRAIIDGMRDGTVDIAIGTHRLLQKDITFRDLGLVIIDEEQRFGVAQKEKLKKMRSLVDVLSMSATPIPRTLYMSLVGIRDISVIETAPGMRIPVEGRVVPFSEKIIRLSVIRELERNCQVFYLHNSIRTINAAAKKLGELVPEARIGVAHGRMGPAELEKVMKDFLDYKTDVLVCTTIIESGLDIRRANTIIIERADNFGLADLYQLKGRVGRWSRKGFAFFMMSPGGEEAAGSGRRLAAVQELAGPGSGFNTAMKDLELRGAGNLLGRQQHGHIAAVGFDLYCRLLKREASRLKGEPPPDSDPVLELGFEPCIPEGYVEGAGDRVNIYRKLSSARSRAEIEGIEAGLRDRFGEPPPEVKRLLRAFTLKVKAGEKGIAYAGLEKGVLRIKFREGRVLEEPLPAGEEDAGVLALLEERIGT